MSYEQREESVEDGQPINLIVFRYGLPASSVYTYTDAEQPIVTNVTGQNRTFAPLPIDAGAIVASGTLDRKTLELRVPSSSDIAQLYRAYPPSFPVTCTIYRGHITDDTVEWLVTWTGRVLNGKHEGDGSHVCALACEPIATALRRNGLRRHYQYMCPHVLYGTQCRASKAAATQTVFPTAVGGNTIDLTEGWDTSDRIPKYAGGVVEWTTVEGNTEIRTILDVENGTRLHLTGPTTGLTTQSVRASLGCNHQMDDCTALFNNILNFGGMPWIPTNNPIGTFTNAFY